MVSLGKQSTTSGFSRSMLVYLSANPIKSHMGCQLLTAMHIRPLANGKVRNINEGLIKDLNKILRKGDGEWKGRLLRRPSWGLANHGRK